MRSTQRVIDLYYRSPVSVPAHCPSAPRKSRGFAIKTQYSVADWQITRSILQGADEITALALFTYTHGALCCITSFFYTDRASSSLYDRHIFFLSLYMYVKPIVTRLYSIFLYFKEEIYTYKVVYESIQTLFHRRFISVYSETFWNFTSAITRQILKDKYWKLLYENEYFELEYFGY